MNRTYKVIRRVRSEAGDKEYEVETSDGLRLLIGMTKRPVPRWNSRYYREDRRQYDKTPRLYVHHAEETNALEQFFNRHDRPHRQYRDIVLPILRTLFRLRDTVKFTWSQKAGCSCPCSPGFVLKEPGYGLGAVDFHVRIEGIPVTTVGYSLATEEGLERLAQGRAVAV